MASHSSWYGTSLPYSCTSASFAPNARQPPASATPAASRRIRDLGIAGTLGWAPLWSRPPGARTRECPSIGGALLLDFSNAARTIFPPIEGSPARFKRRGAITPPTPQINASHAYVARLPDPAYLYRLRRRDRLRSQEVHEEFVGLPHVRPLDPDLGDRAGIHLGEPRRARARRHGGERRQVRRHNRPLLLGGRHTGDGVPLRVHDAVLLRLEGALRARVPEDAL